MITVKFLGGAKKSFPEGILSINKENISIQQLLDLLLMQKSEETPELDTTNILVAINGADSSVMGGKSALVNSGDEITIIPVIHGGASRIQFKVGKSTVEVFSIINKKNIPEHFLDDLRNKFPKLIIQAISQNFILNKSHIQKILSISFHAQKQNVMISKKLETDILMRFAGTTQISQAITRVGINNTKNIFLIAIGPKPSLDKLHSFLKPQFNSEFFSKNAKNFLLKEFKISKKHIESVDSKTPIEEILVEQAAVLF